jgi:hypothetical protein
MAKFYILNDNGEPERANILTWMDWFSNPDNQNNRIIAKTNIKGCQISTIFIGFNSSMGNERPELFETMVFGGELDGKYVRYSTRQEAKNGHEEMVATVLKTNPKKQSIHE